jgi:polyisoprenoid-binding protein YceI
MVTTVRGAFTDIGGKAHLVPADPPASSVSIRPVTVDFTLTGSAKDPWGNVRVGFEGAPAINRSEWGLTWNTALDTGGVLVGDRIQIECDVSAVRNS